MGPAADAELLPTIYTKARNVTSTFIILHNNTLPLYERSCEDENPSDVSDKRVRAK